MKKALIINAHQEYPFAKGELNKEIAKRIGEHLQSVGYEIKTTTMKDDWQAEEEVEKHTWADVVILQSPANWMGLPWSFKKYMDEVYTAGMFGTMSQNDGRTAESPKKNYGGGGLLQNTNICFRSLLMRPKSLLMILMIFLKGKLSMICFFLNT